MSVKKLSLVGVFALMLSSLAFASAPPAKHPKTGDPLVIEITPSSDGVISSTGAIRKGVSLG